MGCIRGSMLSMLFGAIVPLVSGCVSDADAVSERSCGASAPVSYVSCAGSYIDGSCPSGGCGFGDLAMKAYAAWRSRALSLSGLSAEVFDQRVAITTVDVDLGPEVRIEYVLLLDWVRARRATTMDFTSASDPATDAEVDAAVDASINGAEWARLGSIQSVAAQADVISAIQGCDCDIALDWCGVDFDPLSGALVARGASKRPSTEGGACLNAAVDVSTGELLSCAAASCASP